MSMTRRYFLGLAAAAAAAQVSCRRSTGRPPNVVFVLTDDQRWDCLGCAGHPFLKTPNMDRLSNEGVRFANAFVTNSLCSPSRASFLSGLYPHRHRIINNFTEYPDALASYPRALHDAGYHTAYIGKWHMGENNDAHRSGFDYWASHKGQGKYYDTEFNVNGTREVLKGYYAHVVTDLAVNWLKSARRPFSLEVGHKAPHGLWIPEPKYDHVFDRVDVRTPINAALGPDTPAWVAKRIKTWHGIEGPLYGAKDYATFIRTYHATILSVDDSVGAIYDTLRAMGELDNTIFLFAGDNGFLLGEHASIDKRTAWEESIRIPMLLRYPEAIRDRRVVDRMVLNMDVAPTILDLCGVPRFPTDGRSVRPLLDGRSDDWRTSWFYMYNFENEFPYTPNVRSVRTDDWKYIHYPHGDGGPDRWKAELYNLKSDPMETRNLVEDPSAASKLKELREELARLQRETADPVRMPIDDGIKQTLPSDAHRAVNRSGLEKK